MMINVAVTENPLAILQIIHAAFERYKNDPMPSSALFETTLTIEQQLQQGTIIFGAYKYSQLVGVVKCDIVEDVLYFHRLAILPSFQGQHITRHLIEHLIQYGKALKLARIQCKVRASEQQNIAIYTHFGFKVVEKQWTMSPLHFEMEVYTMEKYIENT